MLVDSHCHLNFPDFVPDLDVVIDRAREQGVGVMQTICTKISEFEQVHAVASKYDNIWCSVGIHPHSAGDESVTEAELTAFTQRPKVIGIGETGLDYYYEHSPRDAQQKSFLTHIAVGRVTGLPLIIHTRDADDDTISMISSEMKKGKFSALIHCFSSGVRLAEAMLELGLYISFSGIVTFKKAEELREVAKLVPLDRILVETDAPYLAPMPMRGQRNEPAYTKHTAAFIAELKGVPEKEFARITTDNFFTLFSKATRPKGI